LQISTFNSGTVLRVTKLLPQPQVTFVATYFGWMSDFMAVPFGRREPDKPLSLPGSAA